MIWPKKVRSTRGRSRRLHKNSRPSVIILLIPLLIGLFTVYFIATGLYSRNLADLGSKRLITENWQAAEASLLTTQPNYARGFAYYKVKLGQSLATLATQFSVSPAVLQSMNPGVIVPGTTIKVPPAEHPLVPTTGSNGLIGNAVISEDTGVIRLTNRYGQGPQIITTLPEIMTALKSYNAIEQTGPTTYRINRVFSLDGDIRLDLTKATLSKLELVSSPQAVTCLCIDQGAVLIDGITITTINPTTKKPDTDTSNGRSFLRVKNGRMDIINSRISYLGTGLEGAANDANRIPLLKEGGVYGVSWRNATGRLGINLTTGWVERSIFEHNYFGAYTFGTSGMTWKSNTFTKNEVYGLDPHDDSNNGLIEDNIFSYNGKHGFIVSKRCNYNIIRDNFSYNNKAHGFMIHEDSAYNLIEDNIAYQNQDNFVIYGSNYTTIRKNKSYLALASHVRINQQSNNTFITNNQMFGGTRGIYLYGGAQAVYAAYNAIHGVRKELQTNGARNTVYAHNTNDAINYDIAPNDRMIFGENNIKKRDATTPDPEQIAEAYGP
jgi:parallel beta-helix repeat protein